MANPNKPFMLRSPEKYTYDEVKQTISNIPILEIRTLACLAYASGARVSELNKITSDNVWVQSIKGTEYLHIKSLVLKKHKKAKAHVTQEFRVSLARMDEHWLVGPIIMFAANKEGVLFPHHRATIYRWLRKYTGFNPHGFRKLRATHLAKYFHFTDQQLVRFFDWSDSRPASIYTKLNKEDVAY